MDPFPPVLIVVRRFGTAVEPTADRLRALGFPTEVWVGALQDLARGDIAPAVLLVEWAPDVERDLPRDRLPGPVLAVSLTEPRDDADPSLPLPRLQDEALTRAIRAAWAGRTRAPFGEPGPTRPSVDYQTWMDVASDAVFIADSKGRYVAVNDRATELVGYTREELLDRTMFDLMDPADIEARPIDFSLLEGGRTVVVERSLLRKDGTPVWVELSARIMPDGNLQGIARDITSRRATEAALRDSEARYRQIFQHNRAVKLIIDPASGAIIDANEAACLFYGYSRDELLKKRITDINTLTAAEVQAEMDAARNMQRLYFNFRHRLASGEVREVEVYSGPVTIDGRTLLHSIVHDVTDRHLAEERLRQSERRFRSLIENAADIITILDGAGTILYESPAVRRIRGYRPEELIGLPLFDFFHPDDVHALSEAFGELLRRPGAEMTRQYRLRHRDGRWVCVEASARNLLADPAIGGIVLNTRDITERKQAEEALRERNAELEQLNRYMVDRELRMIELKHELRRLRKSEGEPDPA